MRQKSVNTITRGGVLIVCVPTGPPISLDRPWDNKYTHNDVCVSTRVPFNVIAGFRGCCVLQIVHRTFQYLTYVVEDIHGLICGFQLAQGVYMVWPFHVLLVVQVLCR